MVLVNVNVRYKGLKYGISVDKSTRLLPDFLNTIEGIICSNSIGTLEYKSIPGINNNEIEDKKISDIKSNGVIIVSSKPSRKVSGWACQPHYGGSKNKHKKRKKNKTKRRKSKRKKSKRTRRR